LTAGNPWRQGVHPPGWRRPALGTIVRYLDLEPDIWVIVTKETRLGGNVLDYDIRNTLGGAQFIADKHRQHMPPPEYETLIIHWTLVERR